MKGHLKVLELKNFQKHKNLRLELSPGLNIIAGPTDSGKSSIFRAISWLLTNRPRGIDAYKTYEARGPISVVAEFDDGSVERIKGTKENSYVLIKSGDATTFDCVRSDVPEEIREFLRIPGFVVQGQHDPYYLLQSSPGEIVREIQRLVDLDIISSVIQAANQRISACRSNLRALRRAKEEQEEKLKRLSKVPSLMKEANLIEAEEAILGSKKEELVKVIELVDKLEEYRVELASLQEVLSSKPKIEELERKAASIMEFENSLEEKRVKLRDLEGLVRKLEEWKREAQSFRGFLALKPGVETLSRDVEKLKTRKGELSRARDLLKALVSAGREMERLRGEIGKYRSEFEGINKMLGGVCPLCNGTGKVML